MMRHPSRAVLVAVAFFVAASGAWALDFGSLVGIAPSYGDDGLALSFSLTPWMSASLGGESELYLSGSFSVDLADGAWTFGFAPERSELVLRPVAGTEIRAGRIRFADDAGIVISGLYDGFSARTVFKGVDIRLGGLYGGLQDKVDSKLLISPADIADYGDETVLFAPRRIVMAASASIPGTIAWFADALAQFDTRGSAALHSQYLVLGADGSLSRVLAFNAAMVGSVVEEAGFDPAFSLASEAELGWMPEGGWRDRAYLSLRWATGDYGVFNPYLSVNAISQGQVFTPRLAGLFVTRIGYTARVNETLSADIQSTAFVRSANGGPADSGIDPSSDSVWLGAEAYASLRWAPVSDISMSSGLGLFVPGTAFLADEPLRWLVSLALVASL
ncbi:MAG TPA: hypothetical protein VMX33_00260 [bacterium]|nr:hypothetical protein [bacterium]